MHIKKVIKLCKTGDILFTANNDFFGNAVNVFDGPLTHVGFIIRLVDEYTGEKEAFIIECIKGYGGSIMRPLNNYDIENRDFFLKRFELTDEQKKLMVKRAKDTVTKVHYDIDQLFKIWDGCDEDDEMICSELVDYIYQAAGIKLNNKSGLCTPNTLWKDERLKEVKDE